MAINSRDKRASILGVGGEFCISLPKPGVHEQGDRQQVLGVYRGILAGAAAAILPITLLVPSRRFALLAPERIGLWTPFVLTLTDGSKILLTDGYWLVGTGEQNESGDLIAQYRDLTLTVEDRN